MDNNLYFIERKNEYIVININSLNTLVLKKNLLYIDGEINPKIRQLSDESSFLSRLKPTILEKSISPTIITSFKCNYRCSYCYQKDMKQDQDIITPLKVEKIRNFYRLYCNQNNIKEEFGIISIMGGEPFLIENRSSIEAIAQIWRNNTLSFTTNGSYMEKFYDIIETNNVIIKLSLDGTKEMHYRYRHPADDKDYDKAINALNNLISMNKTVQIITVFHPEMWKEYSRFYDLMEQIGWLKKENLNIAFIPELNGCGCDDIENIDEIIASYIKLRKADSRTLKIDARKLFPGSINFISSMRLASRKKCYECYRCSCLYSPDYKFLPNGTIHFCMMSNDSITQIGQYYPEVVIDQTKINSLAQRRFDVNEKCISCMYKAFCKGGCAITALNKTKSINEYDCSLWQNPSFLSMYDEILK